MTGSDSREGRGKRSIVGYFLLSLVVVTMSARLAPAANGDLLRSMQVVHANEVIDDIIDIARDSSDGSFWVLGASGHPAKNHLIYHLDRDLGLVLGSISNPHPAGRIEDNNLTTNRGIAYDTRRMSLYIVSSVGPRLSQTFSMTEVDTSGQAVSASVTIATPDEDASLYGLSYDIFTRQFWTLDTQNDKLLRVNLTGTVTHSMMLHQRTTDFTVLDGRGAAFHISDSSPTVHVPVGDIFTVGPAKIMEVTATGTLVGGHLITEATGIETPLTEVPDDDPRGIELFSRNDLIPRDRLVVIGSGGLIYEVERSISDPRPPTELTCTLTLRNELQLTWKNQGSGPDGYYGQNAIIQVLRNDVPLATVPGNSTSFVDSTPVQGTSTYSVRASEAPGSLFSAASCACQAAVGPGGLVNWTPFPGSSIVDVTENPKTGVIYVTDDLTGSIFLFDQEFTLVNEVAAPWDDPSGIAYLPSVMLGFPPQVFEDVIAVTEASGNRVAMLRANALSNPPVTTLSLSFSGVENPEIGGLTYNEAEQHLVVIERSTNQLFSFDSFGNLENNCQPFIIDTPMDKGIAYDTVRNTFLISFQWGIVAEFSAGCAPSGFSDSQFLLGGLGPAFDTPDYISGLQISGSTLLVAVSGANALFRVLIFPFSPEFVRGDFDSSGAVNITDAVGIAEYLFGNGTAPLCNDAADTNDDGILDVSDPVYLLFALFIPGSSPPPAPFPEPGNDPTFRDNLGCSQGAQP